MLLHHLILFEIMPSIFTCSTNSQIFLHSMLHGLVECTLRAFNFPVIFTRGSENIPDVPVHALFQCMLKRACCFSSWIICGCSNVMSLFPVDTYHTSMPHFNNGKRRNVLTVCACDGDKALKVCLLFRSPARISMQSFFSRHEGVHNEGWEIGRAHV